eukprot:XP_001704887.1 Hypothetical protein GL50803_37258 [Giardia lamblia ATCC 50803]
MKSVRITKFSTYNRRYELSRLCHKSSSVEFNGQ